MRYNKGCVSLLSNVEVDNEMQEQNKLHMFMKWLTTPMRLASITHPGMGRPFTVLDDLCTFFWFLVKYEACLKTVPGDGQGREAHTDAGGHTY